MTGFPDYPEDFTTITVPFTTHDSNGAPVAPLSALEAADVKIFKNGSATEKTTTNGLTMTSPFNGTTGSHMLVIDSSNDTGDGGFWVAGAVYDVLLEPDETVNGQVVAKWIGKFGIELANALRPVTAGRKVAITAANKVDGVVLTDTVTTYTGNTPQTGDAYAIVNSGTHGNAALKTLIDVIDGIVDAILVDTGTTLDGKIDVIDGIVDAIKLKTDNLPSDPADQSLIIAATNAIAALIGTPAGASIAADIADLPTANEVRDAIFARAFSAAYGSFTFDEITKLIAAALLAKVSGMGANAPVFRNLDDSADTIDATTDADGNRLSVTLTP